MAPGGGGGTPPPSKEGPLDDKSDDGSDEKENNENDTDKETVSVTSQNFPKHLNHTMLSQIPELINIQPDLDQVKNDIENA